ncbi:MAG: L-histidine N(alpha)-methyltransferase [Deltaproteobacteria bacterium]|nr:L-histidine N(alpha)-methyltransferase [Deltaproteobacteria bacterium]MCB9788400.1 L-histidine N(alpha)-methyltransferase [Deltaproteobacteria bacterium]
MSQSRQASPASTDPAEELRLSLEREPPQIPSKYFYDRRGCELFEAITHTPEYYQTRTELAMLTEHADALLATTAPRDLAELGSGSGRKTRVLLDALVRSGRGRACTLMDIAPDFLEPSVRELQAAYPSLDVRGVVGDFVHELHRLGPGGERMLVLLAGTFGNLDRIAALDFLRSIRAALAEDDAFLIGVDLVKDPARLEAAYDDAQGVTAAFNLNVLDVVNARFGADFDTADFRHRAVYDVERARIEMRLRAVRPVRVTVAATGTRLSLAEGEELLTELSCKYTRESLDAMAGRADLAMARWVTDPDQLFGLALLRPRGDRR